MVLDNLFRNLMSQGGSDLPHPEEPMNPSATLANTNVDAIMTKWLQNWGVPSRYWDHWKTAIEMEVYDVYPASITAMGITQETPAGTWDAGGKRHMVIKPKWLNPGVIAHEQAHNSYALLSPSRKAEFASMHNSLKNNDPLIRLLYSRNAYGLSTDVEGHAEVYRYIGQQMPEQLKQYYPMLFESAPEIRGHKAGEPRPAAGQAETAQEAAGQRAKVIAEPPAGTRSVIDSKVLPVAVSSGDVNYLCGSCGVLLIQGLIGGQFNNLVIKCPKCGAFNEM